VWQLQLPLPLLAVWLLLLFGQRLQTIAWSYVMCGRRLILSYPHCRHVPCNQPAKRLLPLLLHGLRMCTHTC
jgi:hypothetical protein